MLRCKPVVTPKFPRFFFGLGGVAFFVAACSSASPAPSPAIDPVFAGIYEADSIDSSIVAIEFAPPNAYVLVAPSTASDASSERGTYGFDGSTRLLTLTSNAGRVTSLDIEVLEAAGSSAGSQSIQAAGVELVNPAPGQVTRFGYRLAHADLLWTFNLTMPCHNLAFPNGFLQGFCSPTMLGTNCISAGRSSCPAGSFCCMYSTLGTEMP